MNNPWLNMEENVVSDSQEYDDTTNIIQEEILTETCVSKENVHNKVTTKQKCDLKLGAKYPSLEDVKTAIDCYKAQHSCQLYVRDSRTIASTMKRTPSKKLKDSLRYSSLVYSCIAGGRMYNSKSSGKRRTFKRNCPMEIKLSATQDGEHLEVVAMEQNHNHEVNDIQALSIKKRKQSENAVDKILGDLDYEMLLQVAKIGFKSKKLILEDIISSVRDKQSSTTQLPESLPPFCVCGYCRLMPTKKESLCCFDADCCQSQSEEFYNICVDYSNLATTVRNLAHTTVFNPTYDNSTMRHVAYRQYIMWQHGPKKQCEVVPSCCTWRIRDHYSSADGKYTGYINNQLHCHTII